MASFNFSELGDQLKIAGQNTAGTEVSFSGKALKLDSAEDASEVIAAIQKCPRLEYLDLEGNTLGPHAARAIADVLKEKGASLKCALWRDMFTGRLKTEIPEALSYLGGALRVAGTHLVVLDLSDNALGPHGAEALPAFLTSQACFSLQELKINNTGLGISGGKMLANALLDCYENSRKAGTPLALKVFVAGRNRLENEGAKALANVFQALTSLEEVVMPQNGIYPPGIKCLAQALSFNPGLRVLNLNDNTICPKGAAALAKALPNFKNLQHLNLGDCLLKTKGGLILAEALQGSHSSLEEVNLSTNEIQKKAAGPIALAMADKALLKCLDLNGNCFGPEGRSILRKALTESRRIESLSTLSDDESEDEKEDEDDDEDEEGEEDEDADVDEKEDEDEDDDDDDDDDEDEDEDEDEYFIENGTGTPRDIKGQTKVTVADFLKTPTGTKLLLLQQEGIQDFVEHAKNLSKGTDVSPELKFVDEFTRIIMKVSALCGSGYMDVRIKAEAITDALYSKLCAFAVENNQVSIWNNALLVNLCLIKSEDKRRGPIEWNLEGCFKALEKICQRDYFLAQIRNTLKFFLEKPVKITRSTLIDPLQESKDSLRAVLDRIQAT